MSKSKPKTDDPNFTRVGQIVGTHGVKGGLKVLPLTDFPARFDAGQQVWLNGTGRQIKRTTWHKGQVRIQIEGITDMNTAETLKWQFLEVPSDSRPDMEEDEFLVDDLVGMRAVDQAGKEIGVVNEIVSMPAHDLLKIGDAFVPMVSEFVRQIDAETRTITLALIPGLLSLDEAEVDDPSRTKQ